MLEIDIIKASSNQKKPSFYSTDETEISEVDTALNTPIGSLMDMSMKRFSTTSSTSSFSTLKSYKKPFTTPKPTEDIVSVLEKRLYLMEQELNERIKRELDLEAQLLQKKRSSHKTTLNKINKRIDQFLKSKEHHDTEKLANFNIFSCYDWLTGCELPLLYASENNFMQPPCNTTTQGEINNNECSNMLSFNKIFIHRLKSILKQTQHHDDLYNQFHTVLNAWEHQEDVNLLQFHEQQTKNNKRVARLLEALNKSVLRNKILRYDSNLIIKQYQSDLKNILKERDTYEQQIQELIQQQHNQTFEIKQAEAVGIHNECKTELCNLKCVLNDQIKKLDTALLNCQEERDEYETTVEMVRREMEAMLEELEDTRQQRLRFKTQASRLRAGLEAIQKKKSSRSKTINDASSSSEDEEEDEARAAIRLMYNEAERQAMDLDRECKRQALTLSSIRKELKLTEEKYHAIKTQKNKQLHQIEQMNRGLTRKVETLEAEKQSLISNLEESRQKLERNTKPDDIPINLAREEDNDLLSTYQARVDNLKIALKAAKSDASTQRTKIFQLERQASLFDPTHSVNQLQDAFQNELVPFCQYNNDIVNHAVADRVEFEQALWRSKCEKLLQKKYDVDLLKVHRELRFLSGRIVELENETEVLDINHREELKRVEFQAKEDGDRKIHKVVSSQRSKELELRKELDVVYQTNQTLQDEILVLCGRNLMMANQLGYKS